MPNNVILYFYRMSGWCNSWHSECCNLLIFTETSETTEKTFSEGANESSSALLIVTIVVITAIVIAVIVTAIVIVLSIKYQRGKVSSGSDPIYEMPSDINTYVLEMKKSEAYGVVTSAQEPYAMSACSAYEL